MQSKSEGNEIFVKVEYGEDVKNVLGSVLEKYQITSGEVAWGIGKLKDMELGYHNGHEYVRKTFTEGHEIVSFHGSIASVEPRFHIHCAGAGPDHGVVGGHFFGGIADPLMEIKIHRFEDINIVREKYPKSGLMEATIL